MCIFIAKSISRLLVLVSLVSITSTAQAGVFNPETFMLKNGMQVVVIPNHRLPVVTHMVWYRVGSGDAAANETGIGQCLDKWMVSLLHI